MIQLTNVTIRMSIFHFNVSLSILLKCLTTELWESNFYCIMNLTPLLFIVSSLHKRPQV